LFKKYSFSFLSAHFVKKLAKLGSGLLNPEIYATFHQTVKNLQNFCNCFLILMLILPFNYVIIKWM